MVDLVKQGPQNPKGNQATYFEVSLEQRWQIFKTYELITLQELFPLSFSWFI